jgi:hypothetical protein
MQRTRHILNLKRLESADSGPPGKCPNRDSVSKAIRVLSQYALEIGTLRASLSSKSRLELCMPG